MEKQFTQEELRAALQHQFSECSKTLKYIIGNLYKMKPLAIAADDTKARNGIVQIIHYLYTIDDQVRAIGDLPSNEELQRNNL